MHDMFPISVPNTVTSSDNTLGVTDVNTVIQQYSSADPAHKTTASTQSASLNDTTNIDDCLALVVASANRRKAAPSGLAVDMDEPPHPLTDILRPERRSQSRLVPARGAAAPHSGHSVPSHWFQYTKNPGRAQI